MIDKTVLGLFGVLLPLLLGPDTQAAQPAPQGIFTAQQVAAGKVLYDAKCANCHGPTLTGAGTVPLVGNAFIAKWGAKPTAPGSAKWSGLRVADLLDVMIKTMPPQSNSKVSDADQLTILT